MSDIVQSGIGGGIFGPSRLSHKTVSVLKKEESGTPVPPDPLPEIPHTPKPEEPKILQQPLEETPLETVHKVTPDYRTKEIDKTSIKFKQKIDVNRNKYSNIVASVGFGIQENRIAIDKLPAGKYVVELSISPLQE